MSTKDKLDALKAILAKAKNRIRDEYDPDEDEGDNELEGLSEINPDEDQGDEADQWLKEQESKKGKQNEEVSEPGESDVGQSVDSDGSEESAGEKAPRQKSDKAPSSEKIRDLDPERMQQLKQVAPHWLSHMDQVKKQTADARTNPHLFAEGHRQAAHNAAHEDFNSAHEKFLNSPDYKSLSPAKQMKAEVAFKKEFQNKNADYLKNAVHAVGDAHQMHGKAKDLHSKEMDARKAHILSGGNSGAGETFSDQEAAQHVGAGKNDEGGYSTSTIKDPAASFAAKHADQVAAAQKPKINEADEYETLSNPEKNIHIHPSLKDENNKKLIADFFKEYHPTITKAAHRARGHAIANGVPEDKIDMGDLHEAGMHGLMQAVHDYSPEAGSSFKAHAHGKMQGLMQSKLASQDYIPRNMRSEFQAKAKGIIPTVSQPAVEAVSTPAAPKVSAHELISGSGHPQAADMADRLKRADAHRSVVVRKKGP